MMPGGHGNENPNSNYMNGRGFWVFYLLVLGGVHVILLSVPIKAFDVGWVWTVTNVGHNAVSFWFLHWVHSNKVINSVKGSDCWKKRNKNSLNSNEVLSGFLNF